MIGRSNIQKREEEKRTREGKERKIPMASQRRSGADAVIDPKSTEESPVGKRNTSNSVRAERRIWRRRGSWKRGEYPARDALQASSLNRQSSKGSAYGRVTTTKEQGQLEAKEEGRGEKEESLS